MLLLGQNFVANRILSRLKQKRKNMYLRCQRYEINWYEQLKNFVKFALKSKLNQNFKNVGVFIHENLIMDKGAEFSF